MGWGCFDFSPFYVCMTRLYSFREWWLNDNWRWGVKKKKKDRRWLKFLAPFCFVESDHLVFFSEWDDNPTQKNEEGDPCLPSNSVSTTIRAAPQPPSDSFRITAAVAAGRRGRSYGRATAACSTIRAINLVLLLLLLLLVLMLHVRLLKWLPMA